ncbi:MAG: hypothetical protein HYX75_10695 [Acidobacteria bacterium]|nr:hypothetical protein [Acidobacteriota bacterium]
MAIACPLDGSRTGGAIAAAFSAQARVAGELAQGELRQRAVVAPREILADVPDL